MHCREIGQFDILFVYFMPIVETSVIFFHVKTTIWHAKMKRITRTILILFLT